MRRLLPAVIFLTSAAALPTAAGAPLVPKFEITERALGKKPANLSHPRPVISADFNRIIFVARKGANTSVLVENGVELPDTEGVETGTVRFSPDSRRLAYVVSRGGKSHFVLDGVKSAAYDGVTRPTFSPDSRRVLFVAKRGAKFFVVSDGVEGKEYDAIDHILYSPDGKRLAFTARRDGRAFVSVEQQEAGPYIALGRPVFNREGTRMAYVAKRDGKEFVVVDGVESGRRHDMIGEVVFHPDGARVAYSAMDGKWRVINDQLEGPQHDVVAVPSITFSPDGKRLAYVLLVPGDMMAAVVDGTVGKSFKAIANLMFSPDGRRYAYAAGNAGRGLVVTDGAEGKVYDDILPLFLHFSPDSRRLLFVAQKGGRVRVVLDGAEGAEYRTVTDPAFSPASDYVVYTAQKLNNKQVLVINGAEIKKYDTYLDNGRVLFKSPRELVVLAVRGDTVYRAEVKVVRL